MPVFLASFFAADTPAELYEYFLLPTIGILSPLRFVSPVCRRHLTFSDVLTVTSFEGFTTSLVFGCLGIGACTTNALLAIAYCLYIIAFLGDHNVRFGGVLWGSLGLVVARDSDSG
jgi:hypothetical protein